MCIGDVLIGVNGSSVLYDTPERARQRVHAEPPFLQLPPPSRAPHTLLPPPPSQLWYDGVPYVTLHLLRATVPLAGVVDIHAGRALLAKQHAPAAGGAAAGAAATGRSGEGPRPSRSRSRYRRRYTPTDPHMGGMGGSDAHHSTIIKVHAVLDSVVERVVHRFNPKERPRSIRAAIKSDYPYSYMPTPFCRHRSAPVGALCCENRHTYVSVCVCRGVCVCVGVHTRRCVCVPCTMCRRTLMMQCSQCHQWYHTTCLGGRHGGK